MLIFDFNHDLQITHMIAFKFRTVMWDTKKNWKINFDLDEDSIEKGNTFLSCLVEKPSTNENQIQYHTI